MKTKFMESKNGYRMGTEPLVAESKRMIIEETKLDMKPDKESEKDKSHPIMIVGSNNVVGKNVFLINTDSDDELQSFLKYLPSEVWDAMILHMTNIVDKTD